MIPVVLAIILVVVAAVWWYRHRRSSADGGDGDEVARQLERLDPVDLAELDERFAVVGDEERLLQQALLRVRVEPLVERRVPVRAVEALSELRIVRVRFADGTALVVRGVTPGDAGRLAMLIRRHRVVPCSCTPEPDGEQGMRVVFGWESDRHHLALRVSGLDQPS
jgi:hypothetical protein